MKIHIYVYNKCNLNIYQLLINLLLQKKKYLNYLPMTINYFGTK